MEHQNSAEMYNAKTEAEMKLGGITDSFKKFSNFQCEERKANLIFGRYLVSSGL